MPAQREVVPSVVVSDDLQKALAAAFASTSAKETLHPVGLSVAVLVPGRGVWTAQSGIDGHGAYVSRFTRFHAASAGKLVTAALVVDAIDRGELGLSESLGSLLPKVSKDWSGISVGHLLNHTSGLGTFDENLDYDRQVVSSLDHLLELTPASLLFPQGTAYRYSNTGYVLLGLVLEETQGRSWEDLIKSKFGPLFADGALVLAPECKAGDVAVGHIAGQPVPFLADYNNVFSCGGIVSSALDLGRLYDAILNARIVSPNTAELLYRGQIKIQNGTVSVWAGRGINRVETPRDSYLEHRGLIPGFTTMAGVSLKTGVTVVLMSNDTNVVVDDFFFALQEATTAALEKSASNENVAAAATDGLPPRIDRQPETQTVVSGHDAHFSIEASRVKQYQWQIESRSAWNNLKDDDVYRHTQSPTLDITARGSMNGERYRCVVTNEFGSDESNVVKLYVYGHKGGGAISPLSVVLLAALGLVRWFSSKRRSA
jgi:CubicO group peptidase (beta-lactamase class C family)